MPLPRPCPATSRSDRIARARGARGRQPCSRRRTRAPPPWPAHSGTGAAGARASDDVPLSASLRCGPRLCLSGGAPPRFDLYRAFLHGRPQEPGPVPSRRRPGAVHGNPRRTLRASYVARAATGTRDPRDLDRASSRRIRILAALASGQPAYIRRIHRRSEARATSPSAHARQRDPKLDSGPFHSQLGSQRWPWLACRPKSTPEMSYQSSARFRIPSASPGPTGRSTSATMIESRRSSPRSAPRIHTVPM